MPTDSRLNFDALVEPLRSDTTSGAATLARASSHVLELAAQETPATTGAALVGALNTLALAILDAQPSMAPLVTLAREVTSTLDALAPVDEVRHKAVAAARHFRESLGKRAAAAAKLAAERLPPGAVLTLSYSSTVRAALLEAAKTTPLRVICLESRPLNEGRGLANELAGAGISTTVAVDAAAESLLPECAAVLLGADSVGDRGVVNKIGSAALARGAKHLGVPLLVATDSSKLLPAGFPQRLGGDRPAEEVWSTTTQGPLVWNRYFEAFPIDWITTLCMEDGAFGPRDVGRRRKALFVPPALARWAARPAK
jgi:translation initiation factor 2B subunit (eIF-2B alpha/beta/delta family)